LRPERSSDRCFQPDENDLAEISAEEIFPGERLVVCRNPMLADERARKWEVLLKATEKDLDVIVCATQRGKNGLSGKEKIGLRVGWSQDSPTQDGETLRTDDHGDQFSLRSP
jgi:hypothetical protein